MVPFSTSPQPLEILRKGVDGSTVQPVSFLAFMMSCISCKTLKHSGTYYRIIPLSELLQCQRPENLAVLVARWTMKDVCL